MTAGPDLHGASGGEASPLLDMAQSRTHARALRGWQAVQQEHLRRRLAALHVAWQADWLGIDGAALAEGEVQVAEPAPPDSEAPRGAWWQFVAAAPASPPRSGERSVARSNERSAIEAIASQISGAALRNAASLAYVVAQAAWDDWRQRLAEAAATPLGSIEEADAAEPSRAQAVPARWSGALLAQWPWCGGTWCMHLPFDAVSALLGPEAARPAPVHAAAGQKISLAAALVAERLRAQVRLYDVELSLGQIQGLRIGDVVMLSHPLDSPAQVFGGGEAALCDAWLGRQGRHVAVELARPTASDDASHFSKEPHR